MQKIIEEEVEKMLKEGVIRSSTSPWSSPIVVVQKKDGRPRLCIDYRKLNKVTRKDAYPLPQINATLDKLRGAKYLSTIDLKNGYWQVLLTPESKPLTAFTVAGKGLFEFNVMPFGLHSAPATFQRLLDQVITPELFPNAFAYLDDTVIISKTFDEHLETLEIVFERLRNAKLKPNPEKCQFARSKLKYLGHVVDHNGLHADPDKTAAVLNLTPPRNVKEIQRFMGLISWYRRFLKDVSSVAAPLHRLLRKRAKWEWSETQQAAFDEVKKLLTNAPILSCPDWSQTFVLQTDTSQEGLGATLTQQIRGSERVIEYASRTLTSSEKNYSATELECLAIKWGIWKFRDYLEGTEEAPIICSPTRYPDSRSKSVQREFRHPTGTAESTKKEEHPELNPDYRIENGQLHRHILHTLDYNDTPEAQQWKNCISGDRKAEVLHQYHDDPTAGHLGVAKTIVRLAKNYYWPGMFREAAQYDKLTKWIELPLRKATGSAVAKALREKILLRHGCPQKLITDNGRQFISTDVKTVLEKYKITHRLTPPYAPQCNPVERANKVIKTMISQTIEKSQKKWDRFIPELAYAYNTAHCESTGYTPAYLNYGRELRPSGSIGQKTENMEQEDPETRIKQMHEALELARVKLAQSFQRQQHHYNLRRRDWKPRVGEEVLKRTHELSSKADDFKNKACSKIRGAVCHSPGAIACDIRVKNHRWQKSRVTRTHTRPESDKSIRGLYFA
ncbi:PREDICTED: uncharacterized protein LOC105558274 [Vollenhovia emeryi]|uniref:uncharacterized protein LOC105558274 n=1 Tax=Vollenhovia emeryi TaxID=411798 RepID=UPI0005F57020|nr:PREDICTED: uncharacterized protein LOC105558274 [Vollenhovia emeryi]